MYPYICIVIYTRSYVHAIEKFTKNITADKIGLYWVAR